VIDTNVFVSAMLSKHSDAATVQLVGRMFMGEIMAEFTALV
jgi:predicted nucleic acid-binding protein